MNLSDIQVEQERKPTDLPVVHCSAPHSHSAPVFPQGPGCDSKSKVRNGPVVERKNHTLMQNPGQGPPILQSSDASPT